MNTTTKSIRRPTITLALARSVPALISYAEGIVTRMTGNPTFPAPVPTLAAVTAALADLRPTATPALARTKGAVTPRNEKRTVLVAALQQLRAHVQSIADADPTQASSIIESAGVAVRKSPTRSARAFAAKPGPVAGVVRVTAVAASRRASYEWQYSADGAEIPAPPCRRSHGLAHAGTGSGSVFAGITMVTRLHSDST
jgi:hypothetical protein